MERDTLVNLHLVQGFEPINKKVCESVQAIQGAKESGRDFTGVLGRAGELGVGHQPSRRQFKEQCWSVLLSFSLSGLFSPVTHSVSFLPGFCPWEWWGEVRRDTGAILTQGPFSPFVNTVCQSLDRRPQSIPGPCNFKELRSVYVWCVLTFNCKAHQGWLMIMNCHGSHSAKGDSNGWGLRHKGGGSVQGQKVYLSQGW